MKAGIVESKKYKNTIEPNTYITGMSSTWPDKTSMAAALNLASSDIIFFNNDGNQISARIEKNYIIGKFTISNVIRYIDLGGKCVRLGDAGGEFAVGQVVEELYFPNAVYHGAMLSGNWTYQTDVPLRILYVPKAINFGATHDREGTNQGTAIFRYNAAAKARIYVDPSMATVFNGGLEGDLAYAQSTGAKIVFVNNTISPEPITDLSVLETYSTFLKLNFTPPNSQNQIDYYEVFVNGKLNSKFYPGDSIYASGLQPQTLYEIYVVAIDEFYNKSQSNYVKHTTNQVGLPLAGLSFYYKMDEEYPTFLKDSFSNNHGTINSATAGTSGKIGRAFNFNKSKPDYLTLPESFTKFRNASGDIPFSISLWLKIDDVLGVKAVFGRTVFNTSWQVYTYNDSVTFRIYGGTAVSLGAAGLIAGAWNHVVLTYNGNPASSVLCVYVNNVRKSASGSHSGMSNTPGNLFIGRNWDANYYLNGSIDEIAGYIRELTASEVSEIYNNGKAVTI